MTESVAPVAPVAPVGFDAADGTGVRVLIIDSGVETTHPCFEGRAIRSWAVREGSQGPIVVGSSPADTFGHGTACASIVHANAPGAHIESLQVLGSTLASSSDFILAGMEWGIRRGFHVLNCSFGSSSSEQLARYKRVVDLAYRRNVWIAAACNNRDYRKEEYPGAFASVISTTYGKLPDSGAVLRQRGELVEFIAMGDRVEVAWKGGVWRRVSGSSYATPHITAILARMRQAHPEWNSIEAIGGLYRLAEETSASR